MVNCFPVLIGLLLFGGGSAISQKTALLFFNATIKECRAFCWKKGGTKNNDGRAIS